MTCEQYADIDTAERYVAGAMPHDEEVAFEQHFLDCDACLETIRGVEDVRDALVAARPAAPVQPPSRVVNGTSNVIAMPLPGASTASRAARDARDVREARDTRDARTAAVTPRRDAAQAPRTPARVPRWVWAAAAAILIGGVLWIRAIAPTPQHPEVTRNATPSPEPRPTPPAPQPPPPSSAQQLAQARIDRIARLAIVVAPPYVSVPVRAESDATARAFDAAMSRYRAQDWSGAADRLRALVATAPGTVSAQFFLGITELMQQQPARAEAPLRRAASSNVTPFADEAHFYLAKAALQRGDLAAAERELAQAVARDAGPDNEARTLLDEVRALRKSEAVDK